MNIVIILLAVLVGLIALIFLAFIIAAYRLRQKATKKRADNEKP